MHSAFAAAAHGRASPENDFAFLSTLTVARSVKCFLTSSLIIPPVFDTRCFLLSGKDHLVASITSSQWKLQRGLFAGLNSCHQRLVKICGCSLLEDNE